MSKVHLKDELHTWIASGFFGDAMIDICKVKQAPWSDDLIKLFTLEKHLDTNFMDMSYGTKKKFLILTMFKSKEPYQD